MKRITLLIFILLATATVNAQDTVRVSAVYNGTDFPRFKGRGYEVTEIVSGYTVEADLQVFNKSNVRGSLAYNFKQLYNVEVYPNYFDGEGMVDLYRNVQTHSGFAQLGYTVKGAFEPFAGLGYGTRKIHTDAPRQIVRAVRVGVNVPFSAESHFFLKGYVDFEKPFGQLPMGFVNPDTRTLGVGGGFRF